MLSPSLADRWPGWLNPASPLLIKKSGRGVATTPCPTVVGLALPTANGEAGPDEAK